MTKAVKTALVTGGARRIGKAIVRDLAAHGFAVVIHCNRSKEEAALLKAEIEANGGRAEIVAADLTDMRALEGVVEAAANALGAVGLLVNNASIFEDDSIDDFDWERWDRHFALHLKAPAMLSRAFAAALPAGHQGLIVNIIDQRVWKLTPAQLSYSLSKSALWTLTQMLAQALAPDIRVNAIGPGPTLPSPRQQPDDFRAQVDALLLGDGPALAELGATIRYLWEAQSVTGQMIAIDGGQHLAWRTPDVTGMAE